MRYVVSRLNEKNREMAYRIYVTDSLFLRAQNKAFSERWYSIINDEHEHDERTGEQVISDMKEKLKQMGGENNGCI